MAVSCPHKFSLGGHNSQVYPWVTTPSPPDFHEIYPQNLSLHSTQLYGVLKNSKRGGGIIQISQKEELSLLSAIWGNLTLDHPCLPLPKKTSFLQFVQVDNIHGHLFEKIFLVYFSPLSPQAEQKEDGEHFANHLQMYVSRTLVSRPKNL